MPDPSGERFTLSPEILAILSVEGVDDGEIRRILEDWTARKGIIDGTQEVIAQRLIEDFQRPELAVQADAKTVLAALSEVPALNHIAELVERTTKGVRPELKVEYQNNERQELIDRANQEILPLKERFEELKAKAIKFSHCREQLGTVIQTFQGNLDKLMNQLNAEYGGTGYSKRMTEDLQKRLGDLQESMDKKGHYISQFFDRANALAQGTRDQNVQVLEVGEVENQTIEEAQQYAQDQVKAARDLINQVRTKYADLIAAAKDWETHILQSATPKGAFQKLIEINERFQELLGTNKASGMHGDSDQYIQTYAQEFKDALATLFDIHEIKLEVGQKVDVVHDPRVHYPYKFNEKDFMQILTQMNGRGYGLGSKFGIGDTQIDTLRRVRIDYHRVVEAD